MHAIRVHQPGGPEALRYEQMYAGVVAMSLLGLALYFVVDGLERRLCPWRQE